MKHILLLLLSFFVPVVWGQQVEQFKLWPDKPEAGEAEIFVYHPAKGGKAAPAVLICPGGGYRGLAMNHEGHDMAKWYASNGFVAVVLKYRMPEGVHTIPLSDAEKAMSVIRGNAAKWNLDANKVGVILYYPVISFDNMTTHGGSKKNLLGTDIENKELVDRYSLQKQVDDKTPKTLLLLSDDDQTVPPLNSILYYTALNEHHIPASLYMFPSGGHGWGFRYDFTYYQEVKDLIQKWLTYIKITD